LSASGRHQGLGDLRRLVVRKIGFAHRLHVLRGYWLAALAGLSRAMAILQWKAAALPVEASAG